MEEFANNQQGPDRDIVLDANKKLTIQPIHGAVQADTKIDAQVTASHANSAPIGNIASDQESTGEVPTAPTAPAPAPEAPLHALPKTAGHVSAIRRKSYRSIIIMGVVIVLLLALLLIR